MQNACFVFFQIVCFTIVIVHFYVLLTHFLVSHYNYALSRRVSGKRWIRRLLLSLNGGISFSKGSSFEPSLSKRGGQSLGMLLFCELLRLVWKQRASLPSRKWTALPPIMMHNKYTFIPSWKLQWGWPFRSNYYSLANVRESPAFNIIFWSPFLQFDYSPLQTLNPLQPHPQSHPFPSVRLSVCLCLHRL